MIRPLIEWREPDRLLATWVIVAWKPTPALAFVIDPGLSERQLDELVQIAGASHAARPAGRPALATALGRRQKVD